MRAIVSTRMYDVCAPARQAWGDVLAHAFRGSGLLPDSIEHAWPLPLADLWGRPGLGAVFMCGWPFLQAARAGRIRPLAGVVPAWPAYEGRARYRSEFLVRDDEPWLCLEDSFQSRYGWMVKDSQSGWNAPRAHLSRFAATRGGQLFAQAKGPYGNPAGLIRALKAAEIDITAVDGWYLDLMRAHCPGLLDGIRTLAYTAWTPNPLLVCSPDIEEQACRQLESALWNMHVQEPGNTLLLKANVLRFQEVDVQEYLVLEQMETFAIDGGYPSIR